MFREEIPARRVGCQCGFAQKAKLGSVCANKTSRRTEIPLMRYVVQYRKLSVSFHSLSIMIYVALAEENSHTLPFPYFSGCFFILLIIYDSRKNEKLREFPQCAFYAADTSWLIREPLLLFVYYGNNLMLDRNEITSSVRVLYGWRLGDGV